MEIVNMTWVNQLRKQYLDILEYYTENPELLNDKNVNKAYCALLSVKSGGNQAVACAAEGLRSFIHRCGQYCQKG